MRKRIIALLLTFVTLLGVLIAPVSAQNRGIGDAVDYLAGNLWDILTGKGGDLGQAQLIPFLEAFLGDGKTPETATETDWQNAYTSYTTNIQNNYNVTEFPSDKLNGYLNIGGWRVYPMDSDIPIVDGSYDLTELKSTFDNYFSYRVWDHGVTSDLVFPHVTINSGQDKYDNSYDSFFTKNGSYRFIYASYPSEYAHDRNGRSQAFRDSVFDTIFVCYYSGVSGTPFKIYSVQRYHYPVLGRTIYGLAEIGMFFFFGNDAYPLSGPYNYRLYPDYSSLTTDSRVGTFSGNFGYYGDGGQLTTAENISIVNETNNTYTNPATGQTSPISSWSYDYSDRSYNLNLEGGSTTTVTYGDEHVTIKEGDTVYNIYYMVPDSTTPDPTPSPSPSPSTPPTTPPATCTHNYTETVTTPPSCLSAGSKTLTCSLCQDTKTEKVPATGHTWVVDRTVNTTYDEEGNVLTQGYTIYKCSSCATEYKDTEGTGAPGDSGESSGGGFLNWLFGKLGEIFGSIGEGVLTLLQTALGKIFDGIIAIINMLTEKLSTVIDALFKIFDEVPAMFSGFTEFLTKVFAYIPPEIITIITFGILAVVLVAIFNAIRGR